MDNLSITSKMKFRPGIKTALWKIVKKSICYTAGICLILSFCLFIGAVGGFQKELASFEQLLFMLLGTFAIACISLLMYACAAD